MIIKLGNSVTIDFETSVAEIGDLAMQVSVSPVLNIYIIFDEIKKAEQVRDGLHLAIPQAIKERKE